MKIVSVIGTRPQFIKAYPISRELKRRGIGEIVIHTGQHYDYNMSGVFFSQLNIPKPDYNLGIKSISNTRQVALMMQSLERILVRKKPDLLLTYGDTNSTLAGALCAAHANIKIAHVEAGLRSYNKNMPEEINRILTDNVSDFLFCPTDIAATNLKKENIERGIFKSGDTMYDLYLEKKDLIMSKRNLLKKLNIRSKKYYLLTLHRPHNVDDRYSLKKLLNIINKLDSIVVFPVHPRTFKEIKKINLKLNNIKLLPPQSYLDMLTLEKNALIIFTDSGGVQKEAYFSKTPCITLREETEWIETVSSGWNIVAGSEEKKILNAVKIMLPIYHEMS
ncbi:non-hydrolyzing UDP-N-acetylglucosamine 2-epimerase, partial [Candidatus Omnitrophota bacterium]